MKHLNSPFSKNIALTCSLFLILTPLLFAQTTFTKVATDTVANDGGQSVGTAWGDFDNDGDPDLYVTNRGQANSFYKNNGDDTFMRINVLNVNGQEESSRSTSATWGDYNNDGHLDLYVTNEGGEFLNFLYLNNGDKTFMKVTNGAIVNDLGHSLGSAWADYNNDGFIDLFVGNNSNTSINSKGDNFLYKNKGDGTFEKITEGDIFNLSANSSRTAAWADADNDGFIDLFAPNSNTTDYFYQNNGDGRFKLSPEGPLAPGSAFSGSWGDYDNDGDLDLFKTNGGTVQDELNYLIENNGDGSFTRITQVDIASDLFRSTGSAWGDFDNDGDLDLFVANIADQDNLLYRNLLMENGDKTFEKVTGEAIVSDGGESNGCSWADFNNDGSLDLVVANTNAQNNFLYQNNGNSNHWIKIKCVGTLSNRFAIGAEVRVRAIINGSPVWQMRQIEGQSGYGGQNSLIAHFGLGDATKVDSVIVEWPSGIIQKIDNIAGDQTLTVTEAGEVPLRANFSASVVRGTTPLTVEFQDLSTADQTSLINSWQWDFDNDGTIDSSDPSPSHTYTNVGLQTVKLIVSNGTATETLTREDYIEVLDRPLFEKITAQNVGSDGGFNRGASWVDYNNDGDLDLFVPSRGTNNFLYRNDGDGQFARILDAVPPIATNARRSVGSTWGDYDNDGDLDLFVPATGDDNVLYRNNGDETFDQIVSGEIVNDGGNSQSSSWGDYDNDGDLDLVVTNFSSAENNFFYQNDGRGMFTKITQGEIPNDVAFSSACNWVDYDDDGDLDLFVGNGFPNNFLYQNSGPPSFQLSKITEGVVVQRVEDAIAYSSSWGDYDNDGDLDLFVANGDPTRFHDNLLYQNNGDGTFTRVTAGAIVNDGGNSISSSWGDYDNDGDLDLFVANSGEDNFLYQNEGAGTFTKITNQEIVQDGGNSLGAIWGDYDNDGFLDLFVANDGGINNFLYRGLNNGNHWLKIKLIGQQSNTTAIGAKIRVKANINGVETRQRREISAQTGNHSMNSLIAHFGLGDAAKIDSIKFEWPSGIIRYRTDVPVDAFMTVMENEAPSLTQLVPDTSLSIQSSGFSISLEQFFEDSDNDPLFYSHTVTDTAVVVASLSDGVLTVQPRGIGTATIAVTATDTYTTTSDTFGVEVKANTAPQITHTVVESVPENQAIAVSAVIFDDYGLPSATLNFRRGGELSWSQEVMSEADGSYQATIPSSSVSSPGIEYFIEAVDVGGLDDREPAGGYFSVQVSVADVTKTGVQPGGSEQTAYRLVSFPLDLDDKSPSSVLKELGAYKDTKWRFLEVVPGGSETRDFPQIQEITAGKGYWLIVKDGGKILDTGPGTSIRTDQIFSIDDLQPGWNLIGNPFDFVVQLDKLSLSDGQSVELREYNGAWNTNPVRTMAPFAAYAINNESSSIVKLQIDPTVGRSSTTTAKKIQLMEEEDWALQIVARCQQAQDFDNIALAVSGASEEWDAMDSPEPPIIGEYVSVYFPHTEWGKPTDKFCTDARPANAEGIIWHFEVVTNIRDKVTLTFEQLENVPEEFQVWLLDEVAHVSQNLRENKVYDVAGADREHPRQLKLIVGKPDFVNELLRETRVVPSSFELFQNFPNPFNPSTTIRYGLPKQETVTLTIYNILGGEVVKLVNDQLEEPGYHAAVWDGRDNRGRAVASGVFFMRLQAGRFVQVRKMLMIQ